MALRRGMPLPAWPRRRYSRLPKGKCKPSPAPLSRVVRFDVFQADLCAEELYRSGRKIRLQIQPFRALALLLEHPGEVVTREEFEKRLWPGDTFVDFDHSLNTAIRKLRQALGDDKKKPRFVETLPKRGYRFVGTLDREAPPPPPQIAASSSIGSLATLCGDGKLSFALLSVDENTAAEREKLDAANDDVGLSLLIASQKLLMVPCGTEVRILDLREPKRLYEVRILDGEHYGKTALVPVSQLSS